MAVSNQPGDAPYLWKNEDVIVELDGVIAGYSRWSGVSGIGAVMLALVVPAAVEMSFIVGVITVVAIITTVFLGVYYIVGRRLATRGEPAMESPYIRVVLTNKRILVFDRGLGGDQPTLVEEAGLDHVSTVRYEPTTMLRPHRIRYVVEGTKRREFEFPRGQRVRTFAEYFA